MNSPEKIKFMGIWLMFFALLPFLGCGGTAPYTKGQLVAQANETNPKKKNSWQKMLEAGGLYCPKDAGNYQIGPEDLLEVNIYGQDNLHRLVRVNREGMIKLPLIGEVKVGGRNPLEVEKEIESQYGSNYLRQPQVTVFVKEYRHQRVSVTGAVNKPGSYEMVGPRSLFEILAEAGGVKDEAGDVVHIIKSGGAKASQGAGIGNTKPPKTLVINMRSALTQGNTEICTLPIQQGDIIHIPYAGQAYVTGEIMKPGKVAVKQGLTVSQAVAMAGPFTPIASHNVQLVRFDEQGKREVISVNLDAITKGEEADPVVKEEDVVVVPSSTGKRVWDGIASLFRGAFSVGYHLAP